MAPLDLRGPQDQAGLQELLVQPDLVALLVGQQAQVDPQDRQALAELQALAVHLDHRAAQADLLAQAVPLELPGQAAPQGLQDRPDPLALLDLQAPAVQLAPVDQAAPQGPQEQQERQDQAGRLGR